MREFHCRTGPLSWKIFSYVALAAAVFVVSNPVEVRADHFWSLLDALIRTFNDNIAGERVLLVQKKRIARDRLMVYPLHCVIIGARMELRQIDSRERPTELGRIAGNAKKATDFLKALAHESRLLILCILAEGERSVGELEDLLNLRQPTVSQQLARLRADGLVSTRRDGKVIYYKLASEEARVIIGAVYDVFCRKPRKR